MDGIEHADLRLAAAIVSWNDLRASVHGLQWKAPLGGDVHWDGSHLTLPAHMPDLVLIATTGRPLRDVFVHPALPGDRIVAEAMTTPDGIRIACMPDMVAPASLVVTRAGADDQRRRRESEHERLMRDATRMAIEQPPLQSRNTRILFGRLPGEPTDTQIQEATRSNAADIMRKACKTACDYLNAGPLHAQPLPLAA